MPIKPENKSRYPANWKTEIRPTILERAGNCCEFCGLKNYAVGHRYHDGEFIYDAGWIYNVDEAGLKPDFKTSKQRCDTLNSERDGRPKWIVIVLTIAHMDHKPENCDPENLRALCQKCHLDYDKEHHAQSRAQSSTKQACRNCAHWSVRYTSNQNPIKKAQGNRIWSKNYGNIRN